MDTKLNAFPLVLQSSGDPGLPRLSVVFEHPRRFMAVADEIEWRGGRASFNEKEALKEFLRFSPKAHTSRIIYAIAGRLFHPLGPSPFGGKKSSPGYIRFDGKTAMDLLSYIISSVTEEADLRNNRESIDTFVREFNEVARMHSIGEKDWIDEYVMRGLVRSGHYIRGQRAKIVIPRLLRENTNYHIQQYLR